jgi:hypothetical protein
VKPPRRVQSSTHRDVVGLAARKEREAEVPEFVCEDVTGTYSSDPDRLARERAKRPTDERVHRLEAKYDKLVHTVLERTERRERHQLDTRARIIVALVGLGGAVAGYLLGGCV